VRVVQDGIGPVAVRDVQAEEGSMTWRRPFAWRGRVRGVVTRQYQPGHEPRRNSINVPIDTYIALCGIADEYGTSISGVVELLFKHIPSARTYARPEGP